MDRSKTLQAFADYVSAYDSSDPKIALKIKHTYKVAQLCDRIGSSIGLNGDDSDTAWVCGMLHDIGRFEQVTRFGTFVDSKSIDHALLSCCILFGTRETDRRDSSGIDLSGVREGERAAGCYEARLRDFVPANRYDDVIYAAIRYHSAYRIPKGLDEQTQMYCNILRDADKLDIFRVNLETPQEEIYNVTTEELYNCRVTPEVMQAFDERHAVLRSLKKTPIDNLVGHISLTYELVYPESRKIVMEQGYLQKMMNFRSDDPIAREQFAHIREEMARWIGARV